MGGLWSEGAATRSQLPEGLLTPSHNRCWPTLQPLPLFFSPPGSPGSTGIRICVLPVCSHPGHPSTGKPSKHWSRACSNPPTVPQVPTTTHPKLPVCHAATEDRRLYGHSGRAPTRRA